MDVASLLDSCKSVSCQTPPPKLLSKPDTTNRSRTYKDVDFIHCLQAIVGPHKVVTSK